MCVCVYIYIYVFIYVYLLSWNYGIYNRLNFEVSQIYLPLNKPLTMDYYIRFVVFQCIERLGKGCLNDQQMIELVRILTSTLNEHFDKQAQRQGR